MSDASVTENHEPSNHHREATVHKGELIANGASTTSARAGERLYSGDGCICGWRKSQILQLIKSELTSLNSTPTATETVPSALVRLNPYNTVEEVCEFLGIGKTLIYKLMNDGELPYTTAAKGRRLITEAAVLQYLDRRSSYNTNIYRRQKWPRNRGGARTARGTSVAAKTAAGKAAS